MSKVQLGSQVCMVAYSERFILYRDSLDFASAVQQFSEQLGVHLDDFAFHTPENIGDEGDQFPYDQENLRRLRQFSAQEPILDLILSSNDGRHDPAWDIYAEMVDAKDTYGISYAFVQLPLDLIRHFSEQSQFELVKGLLLSLNRMGSLDYAFVTTMDFADMPWLYFRGFLLPNVSRDLKLNLALWQRQQGECNKKLRGVYWINFMGPGHLSSLDDSQSFVHSLTNLLGRHNLSTINENTLLFRVLSTGSGPNASAIAVQNLLMDHDLLMLPNVADIPVVDDNAFRRIRPTI